MAMAMAAFLAPRCVVPRRRSSISAALPSPSPTFETQQRRDLKNALADRLEATKGNLDEGAMALITSLEALNPVADLVQFPQLYKGAFVGLRASFKNTGRRGESLKEVGYSGAIVTLGRATFNVFKPSSLDIRLGQTYNHVGCSFDGEYNLIITFEVGNHDHGSDHGSDSPLEGFLINRARYTISGPRKMDIIFSSSTMRPCFPERDLARWLQVFKADNENMEEATGTVNANLPAAKGWLDYLYLDEEIRITKGNRGGISVVRRLDEAVVKL